MLKVQRGLLYIQLWLTAVMRKKTGVSVDEYLALPVVNLLVWPFIQANSCFAFWFSPVPCLNWIWPQNKFWGQNIFSLGNRHLVLRYSFTPWSSGSPNPKQNCIKLSWISRSPAWASAPLAWVWKISTASCWALLDRNWKTWVSWRTTSLTAISSRYFKVFLINFTPVYFTLLNPVCLNLGYF